MANKKSNFIVRGGADFSKLYNEMNKAQKQLNGFKTGISKAMKTIGAAIGTLAIGKLIKDSTTMAMGVETAMENINHNMGQSAETFQNWVNTQSKALGMAEADAYSYGSTFSNLLSSFTSSAKETADQTQELMKATAIIASKTGRTYDDTANRIRSGMLGSTEAIEDLGVYTNISMIESTEAFKKFAGSKSWAQLDFQTQQQIRLAAILEQTYARYGDTLADTTQTRQAQFIASLSNIKLALGQAFLPIYNAVLPALTAMADTIGRVINVIAQFVTALFGAPKTTQKQATAVQKQANSMNNLAKATTSAGKAAKKAAKDARSLAGFDEVNILSLTSAAAGGAGGIDTGIGLSSLITETSSAVKEMTSSIYKIKNALKPATDALKRLWNEGLKPLGNFVFDNLKNFYNEFLKPVGRWILGEGLPSLLDVLTNLLKDINWTKLSDAFKNLLKALAPFAISVGRGLISFIETLANILKPALVSIVNVLADGINWLAEAIRDIDPTTAAAIGGAIGGIVASLLLFKGAQAIAGIILTIKDSFGKFLATIVAHPMLAIAAGIAAVAGAMIAYNKAKFDESSAGKFVQHIKDVAKEVGNVNQANEDLFKSIEEANGARDAEIGSLRDVGKQYLELSKKQNRTSEESEMLLYWADLLTESMPELKDQVDEQTGAYQGQEEALWDSINALEAYYRKEAAGEFLKELYKQRWENEKTLIDTQEEREEAYNAMKKAEEEYYQKYGKYPDIIQGVQLGTTKLGRAYTENLDAVTALDNELEELKANQKRNSEETERATKIISTNGKEWDIAADKVDDTTESVKDFKKQTHSGMGVNIPISSNVSAALRDIYTRVTTFKLPTMNVKIGANTSALEAARKGIRGYATGGMPETGQLFYAREDGPELLGTIGGSTAVVNNDQIVESVSAGVERAVTSALGAQNNNGQPLALTINFGTSTVFKRIIEGINEEGRRAGGSLITI